MTNRAICHADPETGQLTGGPFGEIVTPSCAECHADIWSDPDFSVDAGGPYEGELGDTTVLTATFVLPIDASEGDTLTASWSFGDGTPPGFPTTITFTGGDVDPVIEDDFEVTIETAAGGVEGVFTTVKDGTSVGFGIEAAGTIFWFDMEFTMESWGVGNIYFGNINRGNGTMNGVIITADGGIDTFTAEKNCPATR